MQICLVCSVDNNFSVVVLIVITYINRELVEVCVAGCVAKFFVKCLNTCSTGDIVLQSFSGHPVLACHLSQGLPRVHWPGSAVGEGPGHVLQPVLRPGPGGERGARTHVIQLKIDTIGQLTVFPWYVAINHT